MQTSASSLKTPLLFCLTVFLISAVLWLSEPLAAGAMPDLPVHLPPSSLMAFFPLVTACLFAGGRNRGEGIRRLFGRLADLRFLRNGKRWLLPALFLMPLVLCASWLILVLADAPLPEPDLHWPMVPVFFAVFLLAAAGEEAGWMLYVVDPLQRRWNALTAGLVCGAVWALWHLVPYMRAGHDAGWIVWHSLVTVLLRIAIVWLYNNTGRSVPMAVLLHASANVGFFLFPDYGSHYDPMTTALVLAAAVAVLVRVRGFRTLAGFRHKPGA